MGALRRVSQKEQRFRALVDAHSDQVFRYFRSRLPFVDRADLEDLLSEVMAIAWVKWERIPEGEEAAWLIGVARNRLMNLQSKTTRRTRILSRLRSQRAAPSAEDSAIADIGLDAAMAKLTPSEREVLTLSVSEGMTPHDIAESLNIRHGTAAVRLTRARAALKNYLEQEFDENRTTSAECEQ